MSQTENADLPMPDAPQANGTREGSVLSLDTRPGRISLLPGHSSVGASFQFEGEDHTLGNALRYMVMKNPDVEFCGYSIPHPSENKMNIRIQTYHGTTPVEALRKGLSDLEDLCDIVTDKFTAERDTFEQSKA